jgi:N-acetylmuramoyl-L-alanine amidase
MRPGRPTRATSAEELQNPTRSLGQPPRSNKNGSGPSNLAKSRSLAPFPEHPQERRALGTPARQSTTATQEPRIRYAFLRLRQNCRLAIVALLGAAIGLSLASGGMTARAQEDKPPQDAQDRRVSGSPDAPTQEGPSRRALAGADAAMRKAAAQGQFERAEALRAAFEAKTERERSVRDYENLLSAYRRVYLITPNAVEVPPAIKRVGDLYRRMGEQFETRYFDLAIRMYEYLSRDYPESSLREPAMMAIAEIRKNNLSQPEQAQKSYEDFLAQYPHSSLAPQARKAIAEIQAQAAAAKSKAAAEQALAAARLRTPFGSGAGSTATTGSAPARPTAPGGGSTAGSEGGAAASRTGAPGAAGATGTSTAEADPATPSATGEDSQVSRVRIWNADNYTRIIIELGGKAKYQAARISDPDRIYFDIENAKLSTDLLHQPIEVPPGSYLKAVRVAQNRADVVRVVLDVAKVKDYSVFELADPDRLVVDVYGPAENAAASTSGAAPANSAANTNSKRSAKPAASASSASAAPADATTVSATPAASPSARTASAASVARTARAEAPPSAALGLLPLAPKATVFFAMPRLPKAAAPESLKAMADNIGPVPVAKPTRNGEHSLTRALGLKIGRIVIDPGHGGHDTGTIGPSGLMEKDLCLDVALRLGKLISRSLPSAEIIYTRQNDRYIGLEQRTAIANQARADLFISIHANSSDDTKVSGIETYYLNFNASAQAMEVAARENAAAQSSVHDLQDLVTKIARNEKIEESRDLAADIQESLAASMQTGSLAGRNRGVRKAPFVVLVGADMPSVLAEIAFISNPADEQWLKKPESRQRAADGLYHGIERYLRSVNSLTTTISPSVNTPRSQ